MRLARFSVVFVVLLGRICFSKSLIKTNKLNGYAELEEAAIKFLSNCYGDKDKTMILAGDTPGTFVKQLSSQRSHSIVSLENQRAVDADDDKWMKHDPYAMHRVHILVTMASCYESFMEQVLAFMNSKHVGTAVSVLVIGWSPEKKYGSCNRQSEILKILYVAHRLEMPDTNIICRDIKKGIVIYGFNAFTNYAPKPWRLVATEKWPTFPGGFSYFMREYREHEEMCENLFFEKLQNMNGWPIEVTRLCFKPPCREIIVPDNELFRIDDDIYIGFIRDFLLYINATEKKTWQNVVVGKTRHHQVPAIMAAPVNIKGIPWYATRTYPYGKDCSFLATQFRGNKSQTQKIYDVLDGYSWGGMIVVYFITLIFFKYFLRQSLTAAILNLWRLTCSLGLPELPPNVPPRIYLGCLLFFIVTIQGIFTSSLASVMTHDVPVRQVQTIQDVIDFGYTVYAEVIDFPDFTNLGFKDRLMELKPNVDCFKYVERDYLVACFTNGQRARTWGLNGGFYVSSGCIKREYLAVILPRNWALQEQLNKFIGVKIAGDFMTNFDTLVRSKRVLEKELEEKIDEPKIMILTDLVFAFSIFVIGLGCASISFIVEVMIHIYRKKARNHWKFSWICRCVR